MIDKELSLENKLFFLIKTDQIILFGDQINMSFRFNDHEICAGRICNPTKISIAIANYLQKNSLLNRPGIVVLDSSLVTGQLVSSGDVSVDIASHMHVKIMINQDWHYQAILAPGMLLQYQLLFAQIGIYIELFTSEMVFDIHHLRHFTSISLSGIDNLIKLQEIVDSIELDLHTKFRQTIGKFHAWTG